MFQVFDLFSFKLCKRNLLLMRTYLQSFLFFSILIFLLIGCNNGTDHAHPDPDSTSAKVIESKGSEALQFCETNNMNQDFCILIDMGIHSGKKRFFVWDFKKKEITNRFLVGHGCGDNSWSGDQTKDNPSFSNAVNSHRSSLGKYQLGERGFSNWGVHTKYLMHGLESTNSNAMKRIIVFHSWDEVSDEEIYPKGTPEGWGCPTISNASFNEIDPLIRTSSKPVLMWIYNGKD